MWTLAVFMCFSHNQHYHDWCRWNDVLTFKSRNECVMVLHDEKGFAGLLAAERIGQGFGAARCYLKETTVEK